MELGDKIKQTLSDAYTLVIGQNNEAANSKEVSPHSHVRDCDKRYWFFVVEGTVASDACAEIAV